MASTKKTTVMRNESLVTCKTITKVTTLRLTGARFCWWLTS